MKFGNSEISKYFRWPSKFQRRQFFKVLKKREGIVFFSFLALFIFSFFSVLINLYLRNTQIAPAPGGKLTERLIGSPMLINPVYAPANDTDRDLAELVFSGLMKYDSQGKLAPDLVKSYQILEEGKVFEFYLKDNLLWQDKKPLTVDDVIFTIKTIQDPNYKSPLRANWLGVEAEKISSSGKEGIRFKLKNPSAVFLENTTLKILPKHIWENISAPNFPLATYNLRPIGSGPYKLKKLTQDKGGKITSLVLVVNPAYFGNRPNISQIIFKFFNSEKDLLESGPVNGNLYSLSLPRYFALFFNPQKLKIFEEKAIRQALNYATNKSEIINKALAGRGQIVDSPVLPDVYGLKFPAKIYEFSPEFAKELFEKSGFLIGEGGTREKIVKKENSFQFKSNLKTGVAGPEVRELQKCLSKEPEIYPQGEITGIFGEKTKAAIILFQEKYREEILRPAGLEKGSGEALGLTRKKLNEICFEKSEEKIQLSFTLTVPNQPQLIQVANLLKDQWQKLAVKIEIKTFDLAVLERDVIKPRNYEILLFGEVLGTIPDPFPFWHSSQKKDPGLSLTSFENKKADKLLEEARQTIDEKERAKKLADFQDILIEDSPAIFLYNPDYLYWRPKEIKGVETKMIIDPSKRFSDIEGWYIKTKRVFK